MVDRLDLPISRHASRAPDGYLWPHTEANQGQNHLSEYVPGTHVVTHVGPHYAERPSPSGGVRLVVGPRRPPVGPARRSEVQLRQTLVSNNPPRLRL